MTKKIISLFSILIFSLTLVLSSCTTAGVECGLVGKWQTTTTKDGNLIETTVEITSFDKIIVTGKGNASGFDISVKTEGVITSVDGNKIKCKLDNGEISYMEYSDLTSTSVKFDGVLYSKVY